MYTLICRICHQLHRSPKTVVFVSLVLTLVAGFFARKLEIKTSLSLVLPPELQSVIQLDKVEKKFGGLGKLSVILQSEDSAQNVAALQELIANLKPHPEVNLLDYQKEKDFYEANKLLYIKLSDLKEIEKRIETGLWAKRKKHNPLLVDLLDDKEISDVHLDNVSFSDLEKKYFTRLQSYKGSQDQKVLIVHIFPRFDITDVEKCRSFLADVKVAVDQIPNKNGIEFHYTGEVLERVQNEGRLISEIISSGWVSIGSITIFILLFFLRIPIGPFIAVIPLGMGIIWTLALAYFFIGYLSMVTLSLGIILFGLGMDASIHLLSRYKEERRKNLSAKIAFDTIILETGPAVFTSAFTSAAAFFSITITDFKGFSEFGLIAGIGMLCTCLAILLVFPSILILLEPVKLMPVFGKRINAFQHFQQVPFRKIKTHLFLIILFTGVLLHQGIQYNFEFSFDKLDFPNQNKYADSILLSTGEAIVSPTVVLTETHNEAVKVANYMRSYVLADTITPTIHSVISLPDMLPKDQDEKLKIISNLKKLVTPRLIKNSPDSLRKNLEKLRDAWNVKKVSMNDLPMSAKLKFKGRENTSSFTYIFPSVDLKDGLNCMAFADDTRAISTQEKTYYTSGQAIIYADLLNLMIPDTLKAVLLCLATIFIFVFIQTKSLKGTIVLFIPIILGIIWTLGVMDILDMRINYFNLVAFPAIIGIGIDNGVHLYHRYLEEGLGSLPFVLSRTGNVIFFTSLTSVAGFLGLTSSSHGGLFSLGVTAITGIFLTWLASYLTVTLVLAVIDKQRLKRVPQNN